MTFLNNHFRIVCIAMIIWLCVLSRAVRGDFVTDNLPGVWQENSDERKNLGDFLSAAGLGFIERLVATTVPFSNEQVITFDQTSQAFTVKTINGPLKKESSFTLKIDNTTVTDVDLKTLGGIHGGTAEIVANSLVTYLRKPGTTDVFMTAKRVLYPGNLKKMTYITTHLPTGKYLETQFYKN